VLQECPSWFGRWSSCCPSTWSTPGAGQAALPDLRPDPSHPNEGFVRGPRGFVGDPASGEEPASLSHGWDVDHDGAAWWGRGR
jgi:hypothetical protein